jgi:uncharacterized protein YaaN involved in tellurite resistance
MMSKNIKLLEDLVSKVTTRITDLTEDRKGLEEEVGTLRNQLAALEQSGESGRSGDESINRDEIVADLRETLSELRDS